MDLFRRKKKPPTAPVSQEEPVRVAGPEKPTRHKKRHSIGDIGLLWNGKKQTGQNDLELPLSPHARAALPEREGARDLPVRVSKRRAPGPPKQSPKRGVPERMSQNSIAKTTVCSTEVFHDSHIGKEVTSPASSISGRYLSIPGHRKGSNSSSFSGSVFMTSASPLGSVIQPIQAASPAGSIVHESAIYRKAQPIGEKTGTKTRVFGSQKIEMAQSLPNANFFEEHTNSLQSRKSSSHQDLPLVTEYEASPYDDNIDGNEFGGKIETKFLSEPVFTWSSQNVVDWCKLKGFNDYAELFEDSDIDGANLLEITADDLIELDFDLPSLRPFMAEVEHLRRMRGSPETQLSVEEEVESIRLEYWTNENVLHWLTISGLDRFVAEFKDANVTGVDLVKLDMEMLDRLGIISNQDREDFLARLYETMSRQETLAKPRAGASLSRGHSPGVRSDVDLAELLASEVSKIVEASAGNNNSASSTMDRKSKLTGSLSKMKAKESTNSQAFETVVSLLDAQQNVQLLVSYDHQHLDNFKRACQDLSEDELTSLYTEIGTRLVEAEGRLLLVGREQNDVRDAELSEYEDRLLHAETVVTLLEEQKACVLDTVDRNKVARQIGKLTKSGLYDQLFTSSYDIIAVTIHHQTGDGFGFELEQQGQSLVITSLEEGLPLEVGDRLLELNSYSLSASSPSDAEQLLAVSDWPLRMVVLRPQLGGKEHGGPTSEEEALREDLMNVMKDLETAVEEKEDLERRNSRMVTMMRGLNSDKSRLQDQISQLQEQLESSENDWGAVCTHLERVKPDKSRKRSDHQPIINDVGEIVRLVENRNKDEENHNLDSLEPVPYDMYDGDVPLWESLKNENKGVILQALKDALTETSLRRDLDNRIIVYLLQEAPQLLARMIQKDQVTYTDVRQADSYLC